METDGTNQPNGTTGNSIRNMNTWDRPWTLQELRNEVPKWTLASDVGLYHYLEEFSNKLVNKTKDLENQVDSLVHETKSTNVRVHNTFNSFLMLSNTQFIENRVYDDDETVVTQPETKEEEHPQNMSYEQLETVLVPKYTEAIQYGIRALEQMVVEEEELEADETEEEPQERPKKKSRKNQDPYSRYPLPAVIGTREFNEDDYCGLYIEEEEEEPEPEPAPEDKPNFYNTSEDFSAPPPPPQNYGKQSDSDNEEQQEKDLFNEESEETTGPREPVNFASELNKKLGGRGAEEEQSARKSSRTRAESVRAQQQEAGLFDNEDLFDNAESDFGIPTKKHSLRFGEEERSGLFDEVEQPDTSLFGSDKPSEPAQVAPQKKRPVGAVGMPGLFDPNDGGGLFDEPISKPEKTSGDLFGENSQNSETENSGLFGGEPTERKESTSGKKLPAGAVAMPGMGGLFAQKDEVKETKTTSRPKSSVLFGEEEGSLFDTPAPTTSNKKASLLFDESETSLFGEPAPAKKTDTTTKSPAEPKKETSTTARKSVLFDETSGSLFGETSAPAPAPKKESYGPAATDAPAKKGLSLFGNEEDFLSGDKSTSSSTSESKKETKKKTTSLFGEETTENLFGETSKSTTETNNKKDNKRTSKLSLFDDPEAELFSDKKTTKKETPTDVLSGEIKTEEPKVEEKKKFAGSVAMPGFGEITARKDSKTSEKPQTKEEVFPESNKSQVPAKKTSSAGLFGETEDTSASLFGGATTSPAASTATSKKESATKKISLFGEEPETTVAAAPTKSTSGSAKKETETGTKAKASSLFDTENIFSSGALDEVKEIKEEPKVEEKKKFAGSVAMPGFGEITARKDSKTSETIIPETKKSAGPPSLFGEQSNDLFSALAAKDKKEVPGKKLSLFGETPEPFSLGAGKATEPFSLGSGKATEPLGLGAGKATETVAAKKSDEKKKVSLFGEDDSNASLFTSNSKAKTTTNANASLFGETKKADKPATKSVESVDPLSLGNERKTSTPSAPNPLFDTEPAAATPTEEVAEKNETPAKKLPAGAVAMPGLPLFDSSANDSSKTVKAASNKISALQSKLSLNPAMMLGGGGPPSSAAKSRDDPESSTETSNEGKPVAGVDGLLVSLTKERPMNKGRRPPSKKRGGAKDKKTKPAKVTEVAAKTSEPAKSSPKPAASLFSEPTEAATKAPEPVATKPAETKPAAKSSNPLGADLFGETTSASIFDAPKKDSPKPAAKSTETAAKSTETVAAKAKSDPLGGLFGETSDSLFEAPKKDSPKVTAKVTEEKKPEPAKSAAKSNPLGADLFGETPAASIFDAPKKDSPKPAAKSAETAAKVTEEKKPEPVATKAATDLFGETTAASIFDAPKKDSPKPAAKSAETAAKPTETAVKPAEEKKSEPAAKKSDPLGDIFGEATTTAASPKPAAKPAEPAAAKAPKPTADSIFDSIATPTKTEEKKPAAKKADPLGDIFGEVTAVPAKKDSPKPARPTADSIFDSPSPAAKPAEPVAAKVTEPVAAKPAEPVATKPIETAVAAKPAETKPTETAAAKPAETKPAKAKVSAASIFDDLETSAPAPKKKTETSADIFASPAAAPKKEAAPKKKKETAPSTEAPSIFDDPLAKKKKEPTPAPDIFDDPTASTGKPKKKPPPKGLFD